MIERIISNIKYLLGNKWATAAILVIAVVSRLIQLIFFFNIRVDRNYQLLATQNFVNGDGISIASVLPEDLSSIIYTPLIKWPPGYSILISPFYALSGNNYLFSALFLDILFGILLIFVTRSILKLLDTPLYLTNIFTLATSLYVYFFYIISSSDGIAATLFIIALYFTLLFLKNRLEWKKGTALISFFLFACAFMKYLFMPAVFFIPAYIALKGMINKKGEYVKTGIVSIVLLIAGLAFTFLYQKKISGSYSYVSDSPSGFYPENLLNIYPLVPGSLIKPDTVTLLLPKTGSYIIPFFQIIYIITLIFIVTILIRFFLITRLKNLKPVQDFFVIGFGVSIVTQLLLAILSITIANAEEMPGNWWTFIQEPRYYGLPVILLHLSIFLLYQFHRHYKQQLFRYIFCFLLLLMLPEMFRGIVFNAKRIASFNKEVYSWQSDLKLQQYADFLIEKQRKEKGIEKVVIAGDFYYINNRISLYSDLPIVEQAVAESNISLAKTKEPVILFIILNEKKQKELASLYGIEDTEPVGKFHNYVFYSKPFIPINQ